MRHHVACGLDIKIVTGMTPIEIQKQYLTDACLSFTRVIYIIPKITL